MTGDEIREARERAGLTQEQLAQRLGVTLRTVGNWERGATVPRNRLARLRDVFPGQQQEEPGLRSASDAQLLAEIARRFARGEGKAHGDAAAMYRAGESPAIDDVEVATSADEVTVHEEPSQEHAPAAPPSD